MMEFEESVVRYSLTFHKLIHKGFKHISNLSSLGVSKRISASDCEIIQSRKSDIEAFMKSSWDLKVMVVSESNPCKVEISLTLLRKSPEMFKDARVRFSLHTHKGVGWIPMATSTVHHRGNDDNNFIWSLGEKESQDAILYLFKGPIINRLNIICEIHSGTSYEYKNEKLKVDDSVELIRDFEMLLKSEKLSDVTLVVGDSKFRVHKNILSARSKVFAAMFDSNEIDEKQNLVEIKDVDAKVMGQVLQFIYASKVKNIDDFQFELFVAGDKYDIKGLMNICEKTIMKNLSEKNVLEYLKAADQLKINSVKNGILKFLKVNKHLCKRKNFEDMLDVLSPELVKEMFKIISKML